MYLLETHHYDGGLKVCVFGQTERPSWVPPSDAVFASPEVELEHADVAIEFSRFRSGDTSCVTWLGCYMKSSDRQYGDRSNYVAAGLWMKDALVFQSGELLAALRQGLRELHAQGLTPALAERFHQFAKGIASQVVPRKQFPPGASGIEGAESYVGDRKVFSVSAADPGIDDVIESAIVNLSLSRVPFSNTSRVVIWVLGSQPERGSLLRVPSVRELLLPFAVDLPNVIESGAQKYHAVVDNYSVASAQARKLQAALAEKQKEMEVLEAGFRSLKGENFQLQTQIRKLEALPYTGIATQLEELRREIASLRRGVESLHVDVPRRKAPTERHEAVASHPHRGRRIPWRYLIWGAGIFGGAALVGAIASKIW